MRRKLPPLRAVEYFEAVAEQESIVAAAEQLGVTKGAVSQQVRLLEEYLGSALFVRSGRSLSLSDAGQRYYAAVQTSLSTLETATRRLTRQRTRKSFRLTVLPAFASMWLVHRLIEFQELYPDIDIEMAADAAMADFSRSDAHMGIRYSRGDVSGLQATELCRDRLFPVCSADYQQKMALESPSDLARCRLLHDTYWNEDWQSWCRGTGVLLPNRQEGQYFTLYSVAVDAARSGGGVAMGHKLLVEDLVRKGDLVRPFSESVCAPEPYVLVQPKQDKQLSFVRGFEHWLKEQLAG
ncbi:LysR substrate-binding domain-containing protein [Rhodovibrionaceae bacterium A322]